MLVVEDERRLASAVRRGLTAEGFVVDVAHDGVDGLHLAREGGYDAVVLDLMLPGLSGYQVCERLRAERNWVPVLILSAKDGEYDQADGLDLGADDYMTKPFSYVVLAARLRALLRRGARPRPAVLTAGDLRLDPAARTVGREPVTGPAHGLQRVPPERRVDLAPQVSGVDLDHVQVRHRVRVPDVLEQLGLRHHLARPPHQVLEQRELPGGQLDVLLAAADGG